MLMRMEAISLIDADHVEEPTPMPMGRIEPMDVDKVGGPVGKKRAPVKEKKQAVVVTMVHGDVVMLSGDTFEYSIKRFGTSILLMYGSRGEGVLEVAVDVL
ncbi:hypothetical protein FPV67DRAFT_1757465 [Lyophyllum atratum]|nr:hypothetical protein FPV67DRAFT_1757465 [Lyophyllum atratum]